MTDEARFLEKVVVADDGCWLWIASCGQGGYGQFRADGNIVRAHRWTYEHWIGPIPDDLQLDHLCRVRRCVNPAHLEPVTCRENLHRGATLNARNVAKTHCPAGHAYAEHGLLNAAGARECSSCKRARQRRFRERRRAARLGA